jgi:hypothetical protein
MTHVSLPLRWKLQTNSYSETGLLSVAVQAVIVERLSHLTILLMTPDSSSLKANSISRMLAPAGLEHSKGFVVVVVVVVVCYPLFSPPQHVQVP